MQQVEHLVLSITPKGFGGWQFKTKHHDDLGENLQAALDTLSKEGWQAAFSVTIPAHLTREQVAQIVLTRIPR